MAKPITWHNEKRKISQLIPTENNPRILTDKQKKDLVKSLSKFDLAEIPAINTNNFILAGHQRLKVLQELKGDIEIDVRVPNRELTEKEANEYIIRSNKNTGSFDFDILANEWDQDELLSWGFESFEFGIEDNENYDDNNSSRGNSYNDEINKDIDVIKLGHRLESICFLENKTKAIELFSGRGALSFWYKRLFKNLITIDKQEFDNQKPLFKMTANKFITNEFINHIDFDDEGSPSLEIQLFFSKIKNIKKEKFILALTDGNGLNFKCRGKINLYKFYLQGENKVIQATENIYNDFDIMVDSFVYKVSDLNGFNCENLSLYRKDNGNVIYATYLINPK